MCGVCTEEVSWSTSFSGFDAGDLIAARPVRNDFCFHIRQTWALQRNAPVRTERVNPPAATANPPAATVNPAGALHAGRDRKCSGAKGTPTRRLTVSLPSVCLGAGLPQTPGRGSRPPRACAFRQPPLPRISSGSPCPADPLFEGRKPTLTDLGAVTTVNTIIYGRCRSRLA